MKLKVFYIIIFLMPIVANEIVLKLSNFETMEMNIMEDIHDDSNEKENKDQSEEESKVEYYWENFDLLMASKYLGILKNGVKKNIIPNPLLEIYSPPPETLV